MQQPQHRPAQMPQTQVGQAPQHQQQPTVAHSQPASRPAAQPTAPPDDQEGSDWGLAPAKPGITRENKFILFVLLVLVAVFSFVVFRNFQKKHNTAKAGDVAAKDGKPSAKDGTKTDAKDAPPLQDPQAQAGTELLAEGGTKDAASDPFATNAESASVNSTDAGQLPAEGALEEAGAPPQLNAAVDEVPAQGTDLFEAPTQGAETVENAEVATTGPELTDDAPARLNDPMQAAEPMQQPAEVAAFDTAAPAADTTFAQTAGTAAEPIRRRATAPRAKGLETAQAPVPTDPSSAPQESFVPTTPRTTAPRTTAPRTSAPPLPAVPATQPRVGNAPPLDPNDERLGGYREGQLQSQGTAAHRAGSRPQPAPGGQFNPQSEPLVANVGEYIVRPNDNYWRISRKVYGTARYFAALAKHNEATIPDPRNMKPGIKISTPSKEQLEQQYGNLLPVMEAPRPVGAVRHSPNAPKTPGYYVEADGRPAYRIGPGDTLWLISKKTLGRSTRWEEIYELNKDRLASTEGLSTGAILLLPPDASQTQVVGKPVEHR